MSISSRGRQCVGEDLSNEIDILRSGARLALMVCAQDQRDFNVSSWWCVAASTCQHSPHRIAVEVVRPSTRVGVSCLSR